MTKVLALDIATTTGWCHGAPGDTPTCGSVRFGSTGASHGAILARCFDWMVERTKDLRPDVVVIEALLPHGAMKGKRTQNHDLLPYLHGVVRVVAFKRSIFKVYAVSANDVRGHFIDGRAYKRDQAKGYVVRKCKALGWLEHTDEDAADACAVWHYQCSLIDPREALRVSPLFNKAVA